MDEAIIAVSRSGCFKDKIRAEDIRSREDARSFGLLVSSDYEPLTWVKRSFDNNGCFHSKAHFRRLRDSEIQKPSELADQEEVKRQNSVSMSPEHKLAQVLITEEINRRLRENMTLPWSFKNDRVSDFLFRGDLLLGADAVETEYPVDTVAGSKFRLDIAISGPPIKKKKMLLGGIEIERSHSFDFRRMKLIESLAAPLISVDISEMKLDEITPDWAREVLSSTTRDHPLGRRQTYVYLHDMLYPLYIDLTELNEPRHQLLIFAEDSILQKIEEWLASLRDALNFSKTEVVVTPINGISEHSKKMLANEGAIAGWDWENFNDHSCLRVALNRPQSIQDLKSHQFHMTMSRLLLSQHTLIGYKYRNGARNDDNDDHIWVHNKLSNGRVTEKQRILPKRLAVPFDYILSLIEKKKKKREMMEEMKEW